MKSVTVFCLLVVSLNEAARIRREEKYTTKFDYINVDNIIKNERLLNNYINCLLDRGKCTPEGLEIKKYIPHCKDFENQLTNSLAIH